jgi:hypothetical protein
VTEWTAVITEIRMLMATYDLNVEDLQDAECTVR